MNPLFYPSRTRESKTGLNKHRQLVQYGTEPPEDQIKSSIPDAWYMNDDKAHQVWQDLEKDPCAIDRSAEKDANPFSKIDESAHKIRSMIDTFDVGDQEFLMTLMDLLGDETTLDNIDQTDILLEARYRLMQIIDEHAGNSEAQSKMIESLKFWFVAVQEGDKGQAEMDLMALKDREDFNINELAEMINKSYDMREMTIDQIQSFHTSVVDGLNRQIRDLKKKCSTQEDEIMSLRQQMEQQTARRRRNINLKGKLKNPEQVIQTAQRKICEQEVTITNLKQAIDITKDEISSTRQVPLPTKTPVDAVTILDKEFELETKIALLNQTISTLKVDVQNQQMQIRRDKVSEMNMESKIQTLERQKKNAEDNILSIQEKFNQMESTYKKKLEEAEQQCNENNFKGAILDMKARHEAQINEMLEKSRKQTLQSTEILEKRHRAQVSDLLKSIEAGDSGAVVVQLNQQHSKAIEEMKKMYLQQIADIKQSDGRRLTQLTRHYESKTRQLIDDQIRLQERIQKDVEAKVLEQGIEMDQKINNKTLEIQDQNSEELIQMRSKYLEKINKLKLKISQLETTNSTLKNFVEDSGLGEELTEELQAAMADAEEEEENLENEVEIESLVQLKSKEAERRIAEKYQALMDAQKEAMDATKEWEINQLRQKMKNETDEHITTLRSEVMNNLCRIRDMITDNPDNVKADEIDDLMLETLKLVESHDSAINTSRSVGPSIPISEVDAKLGEINKKVVDLEGENEFLKSTLTTLATTSDGKPNFEDAIKAMRNAVAEKATELSQVLKQNDDMRSRIAFLEFKNQQDSVKTYEKSSQTEGPLMNDAQTLAVLNTGFQDHSDVIEIFSYYHQPSARVPSPPQRTIRRPQKTKKEETKQEEAPRQAQDKLEEPKNTEKEPTVVKVKKVKSVRKKKQQVVKEREVPPPPPQVEEKEIKEPKEAPVVKEEKVETKEPETKGEEKVEPKEPDTKEEEKEDDKKVGDVIINIDPNEEFEYEEEEYYDEEEEVHNEVEEPNPLVGCELSLGLGTITINTEDVLDIVVKCNHCKHEIAVNPHVLDVSTTVNPVVECPECHDAIVIPPKAIPDHPRVMALSQMREMYTPEEIGKIQTMEADLHEDIKGYIQKKQELRQQIEPPKSEEGIIKLEPQESQQFSRHESETNIIKEDAATSARQISSEGSTRVELATSPGINTELSPRRPMSPQDVSNQSSRMNSSRSQNKNSKPFIDKINTSSSSRVSGSCSARLFVHSPSSHNEKFTQEQKQELQEMENGIDQKINNIIQMKDQILSHQSEEASQSSVPSSAHTTRPSLEIAKSASMQLAVSSKRSTPSISTVITPRAPIQLVVADEDEESFEISLVEVQIIKQLSEALDFQIGTIQQIEIETQTQAQAQTIEQTKVVIQEPAKSETKPQENKETEENKGTSFVSGSVSQPTIAGEGSSFMKPGVQGHNSKTGSFFRQKKASDQEPLVGKEPTIKDILVAQDDVSPPPPPTPNSDNTEKEAKLIEEKEVAIKKVEELKEERDVAVKQTEELKKENTELKTQFVYLQEKHKDFSTQYVDLQAATTELKMQHQEIVNNLKNKIEALVDSLKNKGADLSKFEEDHELLTSLANEKEMLQSELSEATERLREHEKELIDLKSELTSKDDTIQELTSKASQLAEIVEKQQIKANEDETQIHTLQEIIEEQKNQIEKASRDIGIERNEKFEVEKVRDQALIRIEELENKLMMKEAENPVSYSAIGPFVVFDTNMLGKLPPKGVTLHPGRNDEIAPLDPLTSTPPQAPASSNNDSPKSEKEKIKIRFSGSNSPKLITPKSKMVQQRSSNSSRPMRTSQNYAELVPTQTDQNHLVYVSKNQPQRLSNTTYVNTPGPIGQVPMESMSPDYYEFQRIHGTILQEKTFNNMRRRLTNLESFLALKSKEALMSKEQRHDLAQELHKLTADHVRLETEFKKMNSFSQGQKQKINDLYVLLQQRDEEIARLRALIDSMRVENGKSMAHNYLATITNANHADAALREFRRRSIMNELSRTYGANNTLRRLANRQMLAVNRWEEKRKELLNREQQHLMLVLQGQQLIDYSKPKPVRQRPTSPVTTVDREPEREVKDFLHIKVFNLTKKYHLGNTARTIVPIEPQKQIHPTEKEAIVTANAHNQKLAPKLRAGIVATPMSK